MLKHTAVVSTNLGSIPELIGDGREGLLVPPGDAPTLAAAVKKLLADKSLRMKLGQSGAEKIVKSFNIETEVAKLVQIWGSSAG